MIYQILIACCVNCELYTVHRIEILFPVCRTIVRFLCFQFSSRIIVGGRSIQFGVKLLDSRLCYVVRWSFASCNQVSYSSNDLASFQLLSCFRQFFFNFEMLRFMLMLRHIFKLHELKRFRC